MPCDDVEGEMSVEYHKYLIEFSVSHQTCFSCQLKLYDAAAYDALMLHNAERMKCALVQLK